MTPIGTGPPQQRFPSRSETSCCRALTRCRGWGGGGANKFSVPCGLGTFRQGGGDPSPLDPLPPSPGPPPPLPPPLKQVPGAGAQKQWSRFAGGPFWFDALTCVAWTSPPPFLGGGSCCTEQGFCSGGGGGALCAVRLQLVRPMWWGLVLRDEHRPARSADHTCAPLSVHTKSRTKEAWQVLYAFGPCMWGFRVG